MDRISEGSESLSDHSGQDSKKGRDVSLGEEPSVPEVIEEALEEISYSDTISLDKTNSGLFQIQATVLPKAEVPNKSDILLDDNPSYSMDFTEALSQSLAQSHSQAPSRQFHESVASIRDGKSDAEVSEYIESAVSSVGKSHISTAAPILDLKLSPLGKETEISASSSRPATGIQESDSENESRLNSHRSLSRPSSERSTGSTSYSDSHDFDEEEDLISTESDHTPVKDPITQKEKPFVPSVNADDISEVVSTSLPSISEKHSLKINFGPQDSIDAALGDLLGSSDDEERTPTHTPRAESPLIGQVRWCICFLLGLLGGMGNGPIQFIS